MHLYALNISPSELFFCCTTFIDTFPLSSFVILTTYLDPAAPIPSSISLSLSPLDVSTRGKSVESVYKNRGDQISEAGG